ncbi:MAG: extracellular solute-binding protein [Clostridiaceae bacterium]
MIKKSVFIFVAVALTLAMIAGCAGNGGKENEPAASTAAPEKTTQQTAQSPAQTPEPVKLTLLTAVNVDTEGVDVNDHEYVKFIEKKFNVDLNIISEPTKYAEKLNTTMASGNLPDYFMVQTKNDLLKWADEGLVMPLDSYLEKAPDLKGQIMPLAWDLTKYDGKIYGVPLQRYDSTPLLTFARKDWLQKLKINPDNVKTTDDWYNMLRAFTYDDPDGNGKDDTYGMAASQDAFNAAYLTFLDAFNGSCAKVVNGEVLPYYITDGYRDYLKFMNRLYKEKILDPVYLINSNQQLWDNISNGKAGSFLWFWMTTELRSKGFDTANLVAMTPPIRSDGSQSFYKYTSPVRTFTAISSKCKNPEKVMEILNWGCTEEGGIFVFAGTEGLDYTKTDGKIVIKEDRRGKNTSLRFIVLGTQKPKIDSPALEDIMKQAWGENGLSFLTKSSKSGGYDEVEMLAPYFPELATYDLDKPVNEFRDLAIMGKVDIDSEWNKYVDKWKKAGGSEKIRLMTDWYNKSYKK